MCVCVCVCACDCVTVCVCVCVIVCVCVCACDCVTVCVCVCVIVCVCVCVCVCRLRLCQVQCRAEGQDGPGADGGQPHLSGRGQHGRGTQHLRTGAKQEELCVHREPHMGACYTVGV